MAIKEIQPIRRETDQYRRIAARHHLHFHIDQFNWLTEHAGWKSESREATEPEQQMWRALCPEVPPFEGWPPREIETLDATAEEFAHSIVGEGPYTLSPEDAQVLRGLPEFVPCSDPEQLGRGLIGHFGKAPIHISEAIPKGYFVYEVVDRWREPRAASFDEYEAPLSLQPLMAS